MTRRAPCPTGKSSTPRPTRARAARSTLPSGAASSFSALIHTDLRDLWVTALADLDRDQVAGLRVRLNLRPPTVAALPWEILRDPDRRRTLAANKRILLVRMETLQRYVGPSRPLGASLPLKLLLALPTDPTGQIDGAVEEAGIRAGLTELTQGRLTLITLPGEFNVIELGQALERERPDILHIVTHGQPDGLMLWQDGEPTFVSPDSLRTALDWTDSVKLVVLNACQTARDATPAPMNSLGAQLLQSGLPAVIGMQYAIKDQAAMRFSQLLYTTLMDGLVRRSGGRRRGPSPQRTLRPQQRRRQLWHPRALAQQPGRRDLQPAGRPGPEGLEDPKANPAAPPGPGDGNHLRL